MFKKTMKRTSIALATMLTLSLGGLGLSTPTQAAPLRLNPIHNSEVTISENLLEVRGRHGGRGFSRGGRGFHHSRGFHRSRGISRGSRGFHRSRGISRGGHGFRTNRGFRSRGFNSRGFSGHGRSSRHGGFRNHRR